MTQESIELLSKKINEISAEYLFLQKKDNIERMKELVPYIQEFIMWFMKDNQFGIETQLYGDMQMDLLGILQDILQALEQNDKVLMHDATAYGLINYLECFTEDTVEG